jgi:hypothetical protein
MICVETLLPSSFFKYDRHMLRTITLFLALTATAFGQNSTNDEAQVWELEKAYWEYDFAQGNSPGITPFS